MSTGMSLAAKAEGGAFKALKRAALGGESFFVTTYTAPAGGGWVDVAARLPGDVFTLDVTPAVGLNIQKGSWLASALSIQLDTKWGGWKNFFGSEGGFLVHAGGEGSVVVSCYGALERWHLQPGETITVDTGHMVAYEDTVQVGYRKVSGGVVQSLKSGEGLVFDFVGPGTVLTQTRNPNELLGWITAGLGTSNSGVSTGLGGLLGRD